MKGVVGGSLMLTLVAGITAISAATAGAAPSRGAVPDWQTVPCVSGGQPTDVQELTDVWSHTIGNTTIEAGTVSLLNPANGRTHTFYEAGTVTDVGPPTAPGFGASEDFVARGALIWASRDNLQDLIGTATTAGGQFGQITSHTGLLYEACESVA
jgi:hypothetical protein